MMSSILQTARAVIQIEALALNELAAGLGEVFVTVARCIAALPPGGRVVVSGIGKSGHIARKIAATFASTGTPALFIHPAEASHGDLGMVTEQDIVLTISKSGESQELADIVNYCRRHDIVLVAVTALAASTLATLATYVLLLPDCPEAQPLGVAPTTSTTLSLALGDALALSVLEIKNFQVSHFREFHPGGKLGSRLMRVRDIMHSGAELPIVKMDDTVGTATLEMTRTRFGCVGIVDQLGVLVGIFTDGDLRRHFSASTIDQRIDALMTRQPKEICPDALVSDVAHLFSIKRIPSVFVTDEHRPIGIVHVHDLLGSNLL